MLRVIYILNKYQKRLITLSYLELIHYKKEDNLKRTSKISLVDNESILIDSYKALVIIL